MQYEYSGTSKSKLQTTGYTFASLPKIAGTKAESSHEKEVRDDLSSLVYGK